MPRKSLYHALGILCALCVAGCLGAGCLAADGSPLDVACTLKSSSQVSATSTLVKVVLGPEVAAASIEVGLGVEGTGAFVLPARQMVSDASPGSEVTVSAKLTGPPECSGRILVVATGTDAAGRRLFQRRAAVPFTNAGGSITLGEPRLSGDGTLSLALSLGGSAASSVYEAIAAISVTPGIAAPTLSVGVTAEGSVVLRDQASAAWTSVAAGATKVLEVAFWIPVGEQGSLAAQASAADGSGNATSTQQAAISLIADDGGLRPEP